MTGMNFSTEIDHTFDELRRARNGGNLGNGEQSRATAPMRTPYVSLPIRKQPICKSFSIERTPALRNVSVRRIRVPARVRFAATALPRRIPTARMRRRSAVPERSGPCCPAGCRESFSICSAAAESSVETGGRLLDQFAHFVHGPNDGLGARSLLLDGRVDFLVISVRRLVALAICAEPRTVHSWPHRSPAKTCKLR